MLKKLIQWLHPQQAAPAVWGWRALALLLAALGAYADHIASTPLMLLAVFGLLAAVWQASRPR